MFSIRGPSGRRAGRVLGAFSGTLARPLFGKRGDGFEGNPGLVLTVSFYCLFVHIFVWGKKRISGGQKGCPGHSREGLFFVVFA